MSFVPQMCAFYVRENPTEGRSITIWLTNQWRDTQSRMKFTCQHSAHGSCRHTIGPKGSNDSHMWCGSPVFSGMRFESLTKNIDDHAVHAVVILDLLLYETHKIYLNRFGIRNTTHKNLALQCLKTFCTNSTFFFLFHFRYVSKSIDRHTNRCSVRQLVFDVPDDTRTEFQSYSFGFPFISISWFFSLHSLILLSSHVCFIIFMFGRITKEQHTVRSEQIKPLESCIIKRESF